jgi:hypothetical protein
MRLALGDVLNAPSFFRGVSSIEVPPKLENDK